MKLSLIESIRFQEKLRENLDDLKNILHITARHSDTSLVSVAANDLLSKLKFKYDIREQDLWKEPLVPYKIDHVISKFRIMDGKGSEEDYKTDDQTGTASPQIATYNVNILVTLSNAPGNEIVLMTLGLWVMGILSTTYIAKKAL